MTQKIRVGVLYGGRSGEHEVSLLSAASVVKNLDPNHFEVIPIGVDKQGRWHLNDLKQLPLNGAPQALPVQTKNSALMKSGDIQQRSACPFDVVFPVIHGTLGEDGALQGLLESMDVPYVGAGVLGSAIGMDKDVSKRLIAAMGIKVAESITIKQGAWEKKSVYYQKIILEQFSYPVFVKPANTGSSVGIHKVKKAEDLNAAVEDAFLYDVKILVEKAHDVREIELAVLENEEAGELPLVSIAGEIVPQGPHEFYSYASKYLDENGAQLLIPAPLNSEQLKKAQQMAQQIFEGLECEGMARVDLFLDKNSGEFYFNEVNTIPGFTKISMYPKLWDASGIAYSELLTRLIRLAMNRGERKQALKREWSL